MQNLRTAVWWNKTCVLWEEITQPKNATNLLISKPANKSDETLIWVWYVWAGFASPYNVMYVAQLTSHHLPKVSEGWPKMHIFHSWHSPSKFFVTFCDTTTDIGYSKVW